MTSISEALATESLPAPAQEPALSDGPEKPATVAEAFSFTGNGREYFKIWIVNIGLTIATLGLYSPWAKVRRLQYFYRNTRLADASFDYHGDPVAIFKGRMIAAALFLAYSAAGALHPILAIVIFGLVATVMPWLVSQSLRFRMHNSSYRGVRFRFHGTTRSAYWVLLGLPIISVLSLFTLFPLWQQRLKRYQYQNTSFGRVRASVNPPVAEFYVTYVAALALLFVAIMVAVGLIAMAAVVAAARTPADAGGAMPPEARVILMPAFVVAGTLYLLGVTGMQACVLARTRNLIWNHLTLGPYTFASSARLWPLLRISLTNLLGTVVTLGLFWPFAQVRLMRYLTSTLAATGPMGFEEFEMVSAAEEAAVGEEMSEFFDFEIGL